MRAPLSAVNPIVLLSCALISAGCASDNAGARPESPRTEIVGNAYSLVAKDLAEQFSFNSDAVAIVDIGKVTAGRVRTQDGFDARTTRAIATVVSSVSGLNQSTSSVELVLAGAVEDGVAFVVEGLPSPAGLHTGDRFLVFLSPEIDGLRPVEALFRVVDDVIEGPNGQQVRTSQLATIAAEGEAMREQILNDRSVDPTSS